MRWDNLFDDLESQLEQGLDAEEADLAAQEERLRIARLSLRDRIVALRAQHRRSDDWGVKLQLASGEIVAIRPVSVGKDWLSGDVRDGSSADRQCIVPLHAITSLMLDRSQLAESLLPVEREEPLAARLALPFALRDLARRRVTVDVRTMDGLAIGTIDRVARDHLDLAEHDRGEPRRERAVSGYRVIPLARILTVRV